MKALVRVLVLGAMVCRVVPLAAAADKPNILFIMGDDIGWMQPSIYHHGLMVGETPNIDRIGHEGAMFMDLRRRAELHLPGATPSSPACTPLRRA